MFLEQRRM